MRPFTLAWSVVLLIGSFCEQAPATTIEFETVKLADVLPGQDLWQYNYFVNGRTFGADQGFTVFLDYHRYGQLQTPPAVNPDWNVIVLQPDLNLPDNGAHDALSLINMASLGDAFRVGFVFLGSGTPGTQPFTINQFDSAGNLVQVLETGNTVPRQPPSGVIPEPSSRLLSLAGLSGLLYRIAKTARSRNGALLRMWKEPRSRVRHQYVIWKRAGPFVLLTVLLSGVCAGPLAAQQQFQVVSINLTSSTRVTRTDFDYTYRVEIRNTGSAASGVTAAVTSSSPETIIIDGNLNFGNLSAGQALSSTDTFTLRQNRLVAFDPAVLSFNFSQSPAGPENQPPIADAGDDQIARVGQTVQWMAADHMIQMVLSSVIPGDM